MMICLKTASNQLAPTRVHLQLTERLPAHILPNCTLDCEYFVQRFPDYYLLKLRVTGTLMIQCQRCMSDWHYPYDNVTEIAVCQNDATAEIMMDQYECITATRNEIDLASIITDELYLYAPEKHVTLEACQSAMHEKNLDF